MCTINSIYDLVLDSIPTEISGNLVLNNYMFMQHGRILHSLIVTQSAMLPFYSTWNILLNGIDSFPLGPIPAFL